MTQVNWTRQLGLALALFLLGTAAYWMEYKHKPQKEAAEEQLKHLFQVKDASVQTITLSTGPQSFVFNCSDFASHLCKSGDNSKWEVSAPSKLKADDSNVNALLSTLNNLEASETIDLKDETQEKREVLLKEYGLDSNSRKFSKSIEVATPAGPNAKTVLYLGLTHPIGDGIFALKETAAGKLDENRVYLIPSHFKSNLEKDLTYWRNKKLLTLASNEIDAVQLSGSKGPIRAEKKDGQWTLNQQYSGDTENIESLLNAATYLTAKSFASDDKKDAKAQAALKGLTKVLTVSFQKSKGAEPDKNASAPPSAPTPAPITLEFYQKKASPSQTDGKMGGKLLATVSHLDPLFELDTNSKDRLDKGLKDLRMAKLLASMDRFSAKQMEFSGTPVGTPSLTLVQTNGKWMIGSEEASNTKVQETLDRLTQSKIKDFFAGAAIPQGEKDGLTLTLRDEKSTIKRQLLFWKNGDNFYARDLQSSQKEAFLIDSNLKNALPWNKEHFKNTEEKKSPPSEASEAKK